ncbi:class I SAM-dependent methyltransferase [Raineyella antarctica]|uniref:class I SAM-dependent methyltransferase n=1 Tax=Raineyella antarctica TaxID=1577474 RepID=UPI0015881901|nr:methyltransferase domain-containing protein [Raineyella antarctica]
MTTRENCHGRPGPKADRTEEEGPHAFQKRVWPFLAFFFEPAVFLPFLTLRRRVAGCVQLPPGARLLDVATGTGGQARVFADVAQEVVGVDLSEAMLRVARRKGRAPNVAFRCRPATFEDLSFDAACVSFALHEMPAGVRDRPSTADVSSPANRCLWRVARSPTSCGSIRRAPHDGR